MSALSHELLDTLQADIVALLNATPSLANLAIIADSDGETDARVAKVLSGTIKNRANKYGHVVIVLAPEITKAEANLPGPPLLAKIEIQTLEHVQTNRGPSGTGLRSSGAAMLVLSTLHLTNLGAHVIYADDKPLEPLPATSGLVSHAVTLYLRASGIDPIAKPLGVQAEMGGGVASVTVTGTLTNGVSNGSSPVVFPVMPYVGMFQGHPKYESGLYSCYWAGEWLLLADNAIGGVWRMHFMSPDTQNPAEVTSWVPDAPWTGTPTVNVSSGSSDLTLACASPASTIRYTTDGSYPSPAKTLYTVPINSPQVGTVFRAAAYVAGMPPGDVLEFTIND